MAKSPTQKQLDLLGKFHVHPAPTRYLCSQMITFILHGNGYGQSTSQTERAEDLRATQNRYNGKEVRSINGVDEGTILYIYPIEADPPSIRAIIGTDRGPFAAMVTRMEGDRRKTTSTKLGAWQLK